MPGDDDKDDDAPRRELLVRLGDLALVRHLRKDGCVGQDWIVVRGLLTRYSIGALHAIVLDGTVNRRTATLGRPAGLTPPELSVLREEREDRESVVDDAVAVGMDVLRTRGILDGGWRPDGKASLRTYAVNGCLLHVGVAVRRWRRTRTEERCCGAGPELDRIPAFGTPERDVADAVVDRLDAQRRVAELLRGMEEPMRSAIGLRLVSDGTRSWKDIAVELGVSEREIETGLRRLRKGDHDTTQRGRKRQNRNRPSGIGRDEEIDRDR